MRLEVFEKRIIRVAVLLCSMIIIYGYSSIVHFEPVIVVFEPIPVEKIIYETHLPKLPDGYIRETEPVIDIRPTKLDIDERDLWRLARLINAECGAEWCDDEMLYLTGSVVLNRVESDDFPNTIDEVIKQPGQYSCVTSGTYDDAPSSRCVRIAKELLQDGSVLPSNVVYQANYKLGSGVYKQVQNMYFSYK